MEWSILRRSSPTLNASFDWSAGNRPIIQTNRKLNIPGMGVETSSFQRHWLERIFPKLPGWKREHHPSKCDGNNQERKKRKNPVPNSLFEFFFGGHGKNNRYTKRKNQDR
jgi:hypothetical protein